MTAAADLVLTDAEVHTLAEPDEVHEAVAVRDGRVVGLGRGYDVEFLAGTDTEVLELDGRVVVPGFVDAHTHVESTGRRLVHADLSAADSREAAVAALREEADGGDGQGWVQGFGWDEGGWADDRYLRRADLDRASGDRPVVAYRVDMHLAALNGVALERLGDRLPEDCLERDDGAPTGVVVEEAVDVVREAVGGDRAATRELVTAARDRAHEVGITCVHDKVRDSHAPRVYRDLAAAGELDLRVRIDYWRDHLDAVLETGLRPDAGGALVRTGAIKTFTDGSIGGRTAKLSEPYADAGSDSNGGASTDGHGDGSRGRWVFGPDRLRELVARTDDHDLQLAVHAIGDVAIDETVAALADAADPGGVRHRVEHAELASDDAIERMAEAGIVASCQPNFLRWAGEGGLYEARLGPDRTARSNRFRTLLDAGVPLAFGSDSMPMGPLEGIHHAVNAPADAQRLSVTEALRAYTRGAAYAGRDEDRMGTVEPGKLGDLAVLSASPWERENSIDEIDVVATVVDGEVVHEDLA